MTHPSQPPRTKTLYTPHGDFAPSQLPISGWDMSFSPDSDTWHVMHPDTGLSVRIYSQSRNARAWAKANPYPASGLVRVRKPSAPLRHACHKGI